MPIRHLFVVVAALALLAPLASLPAGAQANGSGPPAAGAMDPVAALIAQYPQGGEGLTVAIATLIESQPNLAGAVITAANCASPAVAGALAAGLAQGAVLQAVTDPAATRAIREAVFQSCRTTDPAATQANREAVFPCCRTTDPAATQANHEAVFRCCNRSFVAEFAVAYSVALAENPAAQASLQAANPPGTGLAQANNLVSPN